ncbi:MAG: DUF1611 domain-containing protein [Proteobacteria bacterium]|nr:DUF1611 domain-containing protein [Pseudomonadota bacterium]MBW3617936.1 DUF1611 domain-containing protein [Pseudomonadota bacterium]
MIPSPYLLYLGETKDPLAAKTARGVAEWRPETCLGEHRRPGCGVTLGLPNLGFAEAVARGARTMIVGEANAGGILRETSVGDVIAALQAGMNVASGLHQRLTDIPAVRDAARKAGRDLFDVREPPPGLRVGTGHRRPGRRLLTVGTDCSVGKMYTSLALERGLRARGEAADFRATGQTGIFIAGSGVPVDAVVADFISGAVEQISPGRSDHGWDIIEGQGSLFHPSYAGVSLGLLHGAQPDALVLCHEPGRAHMRGLPERRLPGLRETLQANLQAARLTNPEVVAVGVALNTSNLEAGERARVLESTAAELGLPCVDPVATGVAPILDQLTACFEPSQPRLSATA